MNSIQPYNDDISETTKVLNFVGSGVLGGNIEVRDTAIMVTRMPYTKETRDENERIWRVIFGKIYDTLILGVRCCVIRYPVTASEFRKVEAQDVDLIFADTGALGSGLIAPCVLGKECDRLLGLGVSLYSIPGEEELERKMNMRRFCVHAAHFLEIVF